MVSCAQIPALQQAHGWSSGQPIGIQGEIYPFYLLTTGADSAPISKMQRLAKRAGIPLSIVPVDTQLIRAPLKARSAELLSEAKIVHFIGACKPWGDGLLVPYVKEYRKIVVASGWIPKWL